MKIKVAKTAGFCWGVQRAMNIALDEVHRGKDQPIFTFGPLIHNPQTVGILESKGVGVAEDIDALEEGSTVVVRAHGIAPALKAKIESSGVTLRDATCPKVIGVQAIIKKYVNRGYHAVILGEEGHPEVIGLMGFANGNGTVISSLEDVEKLPKLEKVIMVSQTTTNKEKFAEIKKAVEAKFKGVGVYDTICEATYERQDEVMELAPTVDAMVVVGGRNSGNTNRLADLCRSAGVRTVLVESDAELSQDLFGGERTIGITAGASTPNWMIRRVAERIRDIHGRRAHPLRWRVGALLGWLLRSNIYLAGGAAFLSLTAMLLMGVVPNFVWVALAALYVYAMHTMNQLADRAAYQYTDPLRYDFLGRYRKGIVAAGVGAGALSLGLALTFGGWVPFLFLLVCTALGTLYSVKLPGSWKWPLRYRRGRDLPGSKDFFVAVGWSAILVGIPTIQRGLTLDLGFLTALIFVFLGVFVRCNLLEIRDIQGDKIVGVETIPTLLGIGGTRRLLTGSCLGQAAILSVAGLSGWAPSLAFLLAAASCLGLLYTHSRLDEVSFSVKTSEAMIDGLFLLSGAISVIWLLLA